MFNIGAFVLLSSDEVVSLRFLAGGDVDEPDEDVVEDFFWE